MRWSEDPIDPAAPGVRRVNFAYVGPTPPDMAAHIERLRERDTRAHQLRIQRRDVPGFRKPPLDDKPLFVSTVPIPFPLDSNDAPQIELSNIRGYESGVAFDLVARESAAHSSLLGERFNVSHRVKSKLTGHIYLGLVLPQGKVVTNKTCIPWDAPEDTDVATPWMYGAGGYSGQKETGATYFLSPRPDPGGIVTFTIAYPEVGIDTASSIEVESERFTLPRSSD
ncbi:hypothetical protein [Rhodococcus oryzae]|uniref:hypothetical protein n=1 Tax=Rhodococcus oryzae TaxID=2571143 RepID=UPI0037BB8388